jgi:hypothetical protein
LKVGETAFPRPRPGKTLSRIGLTDLSRKPAVSHYQSVISSGGFPAPFQGAGGEKRSDPDLHKAALEISPIHIMDPVHPGSSIVHQNEETSDHSERRTKLKESANELIVHDLHFIQKNREPERIKIIDGRQE